MALPGAADLDAARAAVAAHLVPTPLAGALKLETLQPTGSFKVRGALAALSRIDPREPVVTASAGNHGLAVAWAAQVLGRRATIVVARTASPAKVEALRAAGAGLVLHGDGYDEAERHALSLPGRFVSAYNDRDVIAGQATLGDELPPGPLCVACPVGGGGLLAGLSLWARERGDARVVGVEAAASPAVSASVRAGRTVAVDVRPTLADGLAGNLEPGSVTVTAVMGARTEFLSVGEAEIAAAMRELALRHGLVTEGAGAVAFAAVVSGALAAGGRERLVVVLTGRNVTAETLAGILRGA